MKKRLTKEFVGFIQFAIEHGVLVGKKIEDKNGTRVSRDDAPTVSDRNMKRWIQSASDKAEGEEIDLKNTTFKVIAEKLHEVLQSPRDKAHRETLARYKSLNGPADFRKNTPATVAAWLRDLAYPQPAAPATAPTPNLFAPFQSYLRTVAKECSPVVVRGIAMGGDGLQDVPRLAQVYAQLETKTARPSEPGEEHRMEIGRGNLSALDVLFARGSRRVVLVGEPGSGKSTFFQYVTLCLADRLSGLAGEESHLHRATVPSLLKTTDALPFRILLREFAPELDATGGTAEDVVKHLASLLAAHEAAASQLKPLLKMKDSPAFVLFDGLDEVPQEKLPAVRRAICAFAGSDYQHCRIAVSCRTASYEKPEFDLQPFPPAHRIAPLSRDLQEAFVHAWYREIEPIRQLPRGEGDAYAKSLLRAIHGDPIERLTAMAGCPFFLTAMAAVHLDRMLPSNVASLMHMLVEGSLNEARRKRADADLNAKAADPELPALLKEHGIEMDYFRPQLEKLAYLARQSRGEQKTSFIPEAMIRGWLHKLSKKLTGEDVDRFYDALLLRAGLLQSRDTVNCEFAYRFEEFLAGCHLASQDAWAKSDTPEFHSRALALLDEQKDYARQVVLWAAGFNTYVLRQRASVGVLVNFLRKSKNAEGGLHLPNLELAADIARDARMEDWPEDLVEDTVTELRTRLEEVRDGAERFDINARAKAASAIGRLGDLREGVGVERRKREFPAFPIFKWCGPDPKHPHTPFPAEPFEMGGDPKAYGNSPEPFTCTRIKQPFLIARFPVTVEQYQAFVDDHGYETGGDIHWTDAGRLWREGKADITKWPDYAKDYYRKQTFPIRGPENYAPEFQTPNHPRVGVSWYEAMAFCHWLDSDRIRPHLLPAAGVKGGGNFRLAADAEWELAARWSPGTKKGSAVMRTFPWGTPEEDESALTTELTKRCNWHGTGIGHTSAVGLFPGEDGGDAYGGASDMAGNVWEWCRTGWANLSDENELAKYNKAKDAEDIGDAFAGVVRGGSWGNLSPVNVRAANRYVGHPGGRGDYCGFRVVLCVGESR